MTAADYPVRTFPRIKSVPKDIIEHIVVTLFLTALFVAVFLVILPAALVLAILELIGVV